MIGFYDYTVILTYCGLISAVVGIFQAVEGHFISAIFCAGISLLCDTFDGRVARAKKDRSEKAALFGIQIDSLCDAISFGVFPAVLCYCLGLRDWLSLVLLGYYCLCSVIRLGYYNVLEMYKEAGSPSVYHGLPVPTFALLLPAAYMLRFWLPGSVFLWVLRGLILVIGTLYILNFTLKKLRLWQVGLVSAIFWIPLIVILIMM